MRDRPRATGAVAAGSAVLVLFAAVVALPWATERSVRLSAVPTPPPLAEVGSAVVDPGRAMCTGPVVLTEDTEVAGFRVGTFGLPGPPLDVRLEGPGYRGQGRVAAGYPDNIEQRVTVAAPRRPAVVRACIANRGTRDIALYLNADPKIETRARTAVGEEQTRDLALSFYDRAPSSTLERLRDAPPRIAAFRADVVTPAVIWTLMVLAAFVVPIAALAAVRMAVRAGCRPRSAAAAGSDAGSAVADPDQTAGAGPAAGTTSSRG